MAEKIIVPALEIGEEVIPALPFIAAEIAGVDWYLDQMNIPESARPAIQQESNVFRNIYDTYNYEEAKNPEEQKINEIIQNRTPEVFHNIMRQFQQNHPEMSHDEMLNQTRRIVNAWQNETFSILKSQMQRQETIQETIQRTNEEAKQEVDEDEKLQEQLDQPVADDEEQVIEEAKQIIENSQNNNEEEDEEEEKVDPIPRRYDDPGDPDNGGGDPDGNRENRRDKYVQWLKDNLPVILDGSKQAIDKYQEIVEKHKDNPLTSIEQLLDELKQIRQQTEEINQKIDADNILQRDIVHV